MFVTVQDYNGEQVYTLNEFKYLYPKGCWYRRVMRKHKGVALLNYIRQRYGGERNILAVFVAFEDYIILHKA